MRSISRSKPSQSSSSRPRSGVIIGGIIPVNGSFIRGLSDLVAAWTLRSRLWPSVKLLGVRQIGDRPPGLGLRISKSIFKLLIFKFQCGPSALDFRPITDSDY
jgi:hypothetical protein